MAKRVRPKAGGDEVRRFAPLEERLGHRFANPQLLELALTHRSFAYESRGVDERTAAAEPGTDNEQMEFLGDAVLGLVVADALYRDFAHCGEGELTRLRASLVSRKRMAQVGEALDLDEALILGRSAEQSGGRNKPALLANTAEAVIAAVYLDGGLEAARSLVDRILITPDSGSLHRAIQGSKGNALRDPKTLLQELVQASSIGRLHYVDAGESGPAHRKLFCVEAQLENEAETRTLASAEASTKKEAQQKAAELVLEKLAAEGIGNRKQETGKEKTGKASA